MSIPAGWSEKWTPIELAVVLSCAGQRSSKERTFTENKSSLGLRVGEEDAGDAAESQYISGSRGWGHCG